MSKKGAGEILKSYLFEGKKPHKKRRKPSELSLASVGFASEEAQRANGMPQPCEPAEAWSETHLLHATFHTFIERARRTPWKWLPCLWENVLESLVPRGMAAIWNITQSSRGPFFLVGGTAAGMGMILGVH